MQFRCVVLVTVFSPALSMRDVKSNEISYLTLVILNDAHARRLFRDSPQLLSEKPWQHPSTLPGSTTEPFTTASTRQTGCHRPHR